MKIVVFACVHNAGRSQMAKAFFNQVADVSKFKAISAGTQPANKVHLEVLEVMNEVGIDLSTAQPTLLTPELASQASLLVTMGCGENCPYVPGLRIIDWPLLDPKGKDIESVRFIRDQVKKLVFELVKNIQE